MSLCPIGDLGDRAKRRQIEYATQFFGYTPDSLVDSLLGDVADIVAVNLKAAKRHILDKFAGKVTEQEMEEAFAAISDRYSQGSEAIFSKFGCYLREKILTVPEHVLLPEDAAHGKKTSSSSAADGSELTAALERFDLLCARAKEAKVKRAMLTANRENLRAILERQEKALKKMRALKERSKVGGEMMVFKFNSFTKYLFLFPLKMIDAVEGEADKLEKRLVELRPLVEKVENNILSGNDLSSSSAKGDKRKLEVQEGIVEKKFKAAQDDDE